MKLRITACVGLVALLLGLRAAAADAGARTFRGEVADSQCALNIHSLTHSHQEMLKSKTMGGDSTSCVLYCTRYLGGSFVLVVKKDIYHLDDQGEAQRFAGKRVKVEGSLDAKTKVIHVLNMDVEP